MTFAFYSDIFKTADMKYIITSCLVFFTIFCSAQKIEAAKVPPPVAATFNKSFPGTKAVKWEKEKGAYEANFIINGKKTSALFDGDGTWKETETAIPINELPVAAAGYLAKNYKGQKIRETAKLQLPNGATNYEAELNGLDIYFDANGQFLKTAKD